MSYKFSDMIDYLVETYGKTREEVLAIYSPLSVRNKAELIKHTKLEMEDGRWVPLDKREFEAFEALQAERAGLLGSVEMVQNPRAFALPDGRMFVRSEIPIGTPLCPGYSYTRSIAVQYRNNPSEVVYLDGELVVVSDADHSDERNEYIRDPAARAFKDEHDMLTWAQEQ